MVNLTENASKSWFAPAKLNLFLHVIGRRDDGLHELQTLFQLLDFGDSIRFEPTSDSVIERVGGPGLPIDDLTVTRRDNSASVWRRDAGRTDSS